MIKIRGGSSRLRIEQGRYTNEPVERRICIYCDNNQVEDEEHFMLLCPIYDDLRITLFNSLASLTGTTSESFFTITSRDSLDKPLALYIPFVKKVIAYIKKAMFRRAALKKQKKDS